LVSVLHRTLVHQESKASRWCRIDKHEHRGAVVPCSFRGMKSEKAGLCRFAPQKWRVSRRYGNREAAYGMAA